MNNIDIFNNVAGVFLNFFSNPSYIILFLNKLDYVANLKKDKNICLIFLTITYYSLFTSDIHF